METKNYIKNREIKNKLNEEKPTFLDPSDDGKGYTCPICGSGKNGHHGTGIIENPDQRNVYTCFGCGNFRNSDVIDLLQAHYGTSSFLETIERGAEFYGYDITSDVNNDTVKRNTANTASTDNSNISANTDIAPDNYDDYYIRCRDNLAKSPLAQSYLEGRGIRVSTALSANIGFDGKWRHPSAKRSYPSPRLIVPHANNSYLARSTDKNNPIPKMHVGQAAIWGKDKLNGDEDIVIVVEGVLDGLSITEVSNYSVVAIGSTSSTHLLAEYLRAHTNYTRFLLAMDNDDSGAKATNQILEECHEFAILIPIDICLGRKDPNEALVADRAAFAAQIEKEVSRALSIWVD